MGWDLRVSWPPLWWAGGGRLCLWLDRSGAAGWYSADSNSIGFQSVCFQQLPCEVALDTMTITDIVPQRSRRKFSYYPLRERMENEEALDKCLTMMEMTVTYSPWLSHTCIWIPRIPLHSGYFLVSWWEEVWWQCWKGITCINIHLGWDTLRQLTSDKPLRLQVHLGFGHLELPASAISSRRGGETEEQESRSMRRTSICYQGAMKH